MVNKNCYKIFFLKKCIKSQVLFCHQLNTPEMDKWSFLRASQSFWFRPKGLKSCETLSFTSLLTRCLLRPHQNLSGNPEDTDQTQSLLLLLHKLHQSLNFYKARLSLVVACTNTHSHTHTKIFSEDPWTPLK